MMQAEETIEKRFELLKLEMSNISSRISSSIDNLWKIRSLEMALWTAATSVGLGQFSSTKEPITELLIITFFIPLWFFWIDARYNRWYRKMTMRESHIQQFINDDEYILPNKNIHVSFNSSTEGLNKFPVQDMAGKATFGNDPVFRWRTSLWRCFIDTIPLFIYGSQMLCVAILLSTLPSYHSGKIFILGAVIFFSVLIIISLIAKRVILKPALQNKKKKSD